MAFVDISGFTALSERLKEQHGKGGSEKLNVYINAYFEKLIGKCLSIEQQREMQKRHGSCTETYDGDAEGLGKCLAGLGE